MLALADNLKEVRQAWNRAVLPRDRVIELKKEKKKQQRLLPPNILNVPQYFILLDLYPQLRTKEHWLLKTLEKRLCCFVH